MSDTQIRPGIGSGGLSGGTVVSRTLPPTALAPVAASSGLPHGLPVCRSGGKVTAAAADGSANAASVVGLLTTPTIAGERAIMQFTGLVTLTTEQWDIVAGTSGGLVEGTQYYLNDGGGLTASVLAGGSYIAPVGVAWSSTALLLLPQAPIPTTP